MIGPTWEQVLTRAQALNVNPSDQSHWRVFRDLELERPARLALHNRRALAWLSTQEDIVNCQSDQIAAAELAVNRQIEERQVAVGVGQLQPNTNRPNLFGLKWKLLANYAGFVPWRTRRARRWRY